MIYCPRATKIIAHDPAARGRFVDHSVGACAVQRESRRTHRTSLRSMTGNCSRPLPRQQTSDASVAGSTDGIMSMGILIALIVLVADAAQPQLCGRGRPNSGPASRPDSTPELSQVLHQAANFKVAAKLRSGPRLPASRRCDALSQWWVRIEQPHYPRLRIYLSEILVCQSHHGRCKGLGFSSNG